jgi:hypothetical protein
MCSEYGLRYVLETLRIVGKIRIDTRAYDLGDQSALCIRILYSHQHFTECSIRIRNTDQVPKP